MLSLVGAPEIPGLGGLSDLTGGMIPGVAPKEEEKELNGEPPALALSPEEQEKQDVVNQVDAAVTEVNIFSPFYFYFLDFSHFIACLKDFLLFSGKFRWELTTYKCILAIEVHFAPFDVYSFKVIDFHTYGLFGSN